MKEVVYRVSRYDGSKEWVQEYTLPYEKGKTILWGLLKIHDELDPTLKFRSACRSAICGSCAVRVNGKAMLACKTSLDQIIELYNSNTVTIQPLSNFMVIRDLIVDWEPKFEKMKEVAPWLLCPDDHDDSAGFTQSKQAVEKFTEAADCILCGICASECPQLNVNSAGFCDPFTFNKAYRFAADSRDASPQTHVEAALKGDLWKCVQCMKCVTMCPKTIDLPSEISKLRAKSISMGYKDNPGAGYAIAVTEDIKKTGRVSESTLPTKFQHNDKTEDVQKIYSMVEEEGWE